MPARSQMAYEEGGEARCSPASLSMVIAYWAGKTVNTGLDRSVPTVVQGTYDHVHGDNGNCPFNAAYASSFGLKASVNHLGLGQVERWISCGVPVIASVPWRLGSSPGRPYRIRRVTSARDPGLRRLGNIITNDSAGHDGSQVRRLYLRNEFVRAWASGSGGVAHIVYPDGWGAPAGAYGSQ